MMKAPKTRMWTVGKPQYPARKTRMKTMKITLVPYAYQRYGNYFLVVVDKDNMHPDPSKLLIWGRNEKGDMVAGDFKYAYEKIGKPVHFTIKVKDTYWAHIMEQRSEKIKKFIQSHKWPEVKEEMNILSPELLHKKVK